MDSNYSLSDVAAVTRGNDGFGFGGDAGFFWIFALLLLPMLNGGGFWGNNRGNAVTDAELCQSQNFTQLENAVGRGFDQQTQFAFQNQRDMCTSTATLSSQIAANAAAQERCCCETKGLIQQTQYENAQNTAAINANVTAQVQKVLDAICGNRMADMQNQINQLQLNAALCGVPKFQPGTVYGAVPANPFFGNWNSCGGCCGNGNI